MLRSKTGEWVLSDRTTRAEVEGIGPVTCGAQESTYNHTHREVNSQRYRSSLGVVIIHQGDVPYTSIGRYRIVEYEAQIP